MWDRVNRVVRSHAVVSACIPCIVFSSILLALSVPLENLTLSGMAIVTTVVKLALSAMIVWLMRKIQVFNTNNFRLGKMGKSLFLICVCATFAIIALLFTFVMLPGNRFISPNPSDFVTVALSQLLGVGVFEEVLFRGLVFGILLKKMGHSKRGLLNACAISSVIFGMYHIVNIDSIVVNAEVLSIGVVYPVISQIIYSTAFGLLAVALFIRSGTLWVPILIHGVGNLVVQTFFAFVSRDRILQFIETPIVMSLPEFIISTLMSTIPLLLAGLLLLRKASP